MWESALALRSLPPPLLSSLAPSLSVSHKKEREREINLFYYSKQIKNFEIIEIFQRYSHLNREEKIGRVREREIDTLTLNLIKDIFKYNIKKIFFCVAIKKIRIFSPISTFLSFFFCYNIKKKEKKSTLSRKWFLFQTFRRSRRSYRVKWRWW